MQETAPDVEYDPDGHWLQEPELSEEENCPAGHTEQVLPETALPAGQTIQLELPCVEVVPGGHCLQLLSFQ